MGFLDRLLGRGKKAAGELADKPEPRREGALKEAEGAVEERAAAAEAKVQEERERAAEHRAERES